MSSLQQLQERESELRRLNEQLEKRKTAVIHSTEEAVSRRESRGRRSSSDSLLGQDSDMHGSVDSSDAAAATAGSAGCVHGGTSDGDADDDGFSLGVGSEATVRFQRAKIRVLEQELEKLTSDYKETSRLLGEERKEHKKESEQLVVLQRRTKSQDTEIEKQRKRADFNARKLETADLELAATKKELEVALRARRSDRGDISTKDVRLNRALEELEKFKGLLNDKKQAEREKQADAKGEMEKLQKENHKLTKHKNELIAAFRKQTKLIDVLKRQKLHIEAARMLAFTEEEFTAALKG